MKKNYNVSLDTIDTRLDDKEWLNDELINAFIEMIMIDCTKQKQLKIKIKGSLKKNVIENHHCTV